jgi:hypothetical protein
MIRFEWFRTDDKPNHEGWRYGIRFDVDEQFRYINATEIIRDADGVISERDRDLNIEVTALVDLIEKLNGLVRNDLGQGVEVSTLTHQRLLNLIPTTQSMPVADFLD